MRLTLRWSAFQPILVMCRSVGNHPTPRDIRKKTQIAYPSAKHGAGIPPNLGDFLRSNVGIQIPAPFCSHMSVWFNTKSAWWFQSIWKILINWNDYSQYVEKNMFQTPPKRKTNDQRQTTLRVCSTSTSTRLLPPSIFPVMLGSFNHHRKTIGKP